MEGWTANGTDLDNPPVEWSIERSEDIAKDGNMSVKFYLNNVNDAGKIWLEKPFSVKPNNSYKVNLEYAFASSDWGDINLWRIIAGVSSEKPQSRKDLLYQGDTGNFAEPEADYVWLDKSYDFTVQSDSDGILYVIIGIWGTWETSRIYYVDNIHVTLTELKGDTTLNLQGLWEVSDVRFDNIVIRTYHITISQSDGSVKFIRDEETISTGVLHDKIISCNDWDGYGIAKIYIDNETSMHSEVPQNEFLNRIDFRKVQHK
jgi:hypothetical protein